MVAPQSLVPIGLSRRFRKFPGEPCARGEVRISHCMGACEYNDGPIIGKEATVIMPMCG